MTSYKPADHDETKSVAPLVQFFELVHVGDTIQSMVQVYFDKELVSSFLPVPARVPDVLSGAAHRPDGLPQCRSPREETI